MLGLDGEGHLLLVKSSLPKSEFERGGKKHGYRYQYGINHYSFVTHKESYKKFLGINEEEYQKLDKLFRLRFNIESGTWYES